MLRKTQLQEKKETNKDSDHTWSNRMVVKYVLCSESIIFLCLHVQSNTGERGQLGRQCKMFTANGNICNCLGGTYSTDISTIPVIPHSHFHDLSWLSFQELEGMMVQARRMSSKWPTFVSMTQLDIFNNLTITSNAHGDKTGILSPSLIFSSFSPSGLCA